MFIIIFILNFLILCILVFYMSISISFKSVSFLFLTFSLYSFHLNCPLINHRLNFPNLYFLQILLQYYHSIIWKNLSKKLIFLIIKFLEFLVSYDLFLSSCCSDFCDNPNLFYILL